MGGGENPRMGLWKTENQTNSAGDGKSLTDSGDSHDSLPPAQGRNAPNLVLPLPGDMKGFRGRHQKSYADLANEKLNITKHKDALAEGIKSAAVPDCLNDSQGGGLLGLPFVFYRASTGKCK
jgi:hypothetical protein